MPQATIAPDDWMRMEDAARVLGMTSAELHRQLEHAVLEHRRPWPNVVLIKRDQVRRELPDPILWREVKSALASRMGTSDFAHSETADMIEFLSDFIAAKRPWWDMESRDRWVDSMMNRARS